jgi:hypothetical protein
MQDNTNNNLAYDLSLFEPRPEKKIREKKKPQQPVLKSGLTPAMVVKGALITLIIAFAVGLILYNRVQLTQIDDQINKETKLLNELKGDEIRLNVTLDSRVSLKNVEDYAKNKLGLRMREKYQVQYITLSAGDKLEVKDKIKPSKGVLDDIYAWILKFSEYFS